MTVLIDDPVRTATSDTAPSGLADTALLRINPLPARRLGSAEFTAAVRVLVETEQQCAALADAAVAELFALAAQTAGRDRQRVLDLKRAIYNGRTPGPSAAEGPWPAVTGAWLDARRRGDLARSVLTTGYDTCLAQERSALAEIIGAESFQLSLALTSPQLLDAVRRYARSGGNPSKRDRKSERGILQLMYRAMVRTSPLSRFTAVGFGTWSEQGERLDRMTFQRAKAHSLPSTDRTLISTLVAGLVPDAATTVRRNPSLRVAQTAVRFRHTDGPRVRILSAPLTVQLRTLLFLTAMGPIPVEQLNRAVADRLGSSAETAAELVQGALATQILVAGPALDEQAPDPLHEASAVLREHAPAAADRLAEVSAGFARIATAGVPERVAVLRRLESAQHSLNDLSSQAVRLHVNEDYVLEPCQMSVTGYEQALRDAATAAEFCSAFDRHLEIRALLTTLFLDRFGRGASVPLLDHADDLVNGVLGREEQLGPDTIDDFGPADGSLARLLDLRANVVDTVRAQISRQPDAEELDLDPAMLAELAAELPERFRRPAASYGLLLQPTDGRLVLNGCYAGHGLLTTRFLEADRDLGGHAAASIAKRASALFSADGAVPLEDRGLHGVNINYRMPLLERAIDAEGWSRLRLAHDADRDELFLTDADGTRVRPTSLGMRWLELFPAPLRLAMWLGETSRISFDAFGWERAAAPDAPLPERTVSVPRLTIGRLVLQRRRWHPGADFPAAPAAADPACGHLLEVSRWRAAHGVPEELFIKGEPQYGTVGRAAANRSYLMNRRREKPQYIDLASALTVRVLPRLLERRVVGSYLEEALPGVRQGRHATEWIIEFDRPAGARFQLETP